MKTETYLYTVEIWTDDGRIVWHKDCRNHSDALRTMFMWLKDDGKEGNAQARLWSWQKGKNILMLRTAWNPVSV